MRVYDKTVEAMKCSTANNHNKDNRNNARPNKNTY